MKNLLQTIIISLILILILIPSCIIIEYHPEHDKGRYMGIWAIMESDSKIIKDDLTIKTSINDLDYHEIITDNNNQILSDKTWTIGIDTIENGHGRFFKDCDLNFYDENTIYKMFIYKHIDTVENTDTIIITTVKKRYEGDWQIYKKENRHDKTKIVFTINHTDIDTCHAKYTSDGFVEDEVIHNGCWGSGVWTYEVEKIKGGLKLSGTFENENEYGYENLVLKKSF